MKFRLFIFLFFILNNILTFSTNEFLEKASRYRNELCSYNGIPTYNITTNEITCQCKEKYADEPRKNNIKYINGHIVHCSYERKSRFMAIFLALCLPLGFDFYYLERYLIFSIVFTITIIMIALNIISFIVNYKINLKSKETVIQTRLNKMTNKVKEPKIIQNEQSIKLLNLFTKLLTFNHIFYIIIVLILHCLGKIPDNNNVATENDFNYIFSTPD